MGTFDVAAYGSHVLVTWTVHVNGHDSPVLPSILYCDRYGEFLLLENWSTRFVIQGYAVDQSCIDDGGGGSTLRGSF